MEILNFNRNYRYNQFCESNLSKYKKEYIHKLHLIKLAFDKAQDLILFVNEKGIIFYANNTVHQMLGYSSYTMIGMSLTKIDLNLTRNVWDKLYLKSQKEGSFIIDSIWQKKDKTRLNVELIFNYLEDKEKHFCSITIHNSEQKKQHELMLKKAKEAAETANLAKSKFLANMSHELRTPLNTVLGFTQLIARAKNLNSQQKEYLRIINRSGEHLLLLINDILQIAKIEAKKEKLIETNFDFYALLKSIRDTCQIKATSKNLEFKMKWKEHIPQYLRADESKLRQILINLLNNAIKFTSDGSVVLKISVKNKFLNSKKISLLFEVKDTGFGIAEDEIDNLFQPFLQTEIGRISQEGTGLGLLICSNFVKLMGGKLSVKSTLGKGSCFSFDVLVLPIEKTEKTKIKNHQVIGIAPKQRKYRLLVAEDVKENRLLLTELLREVGFEVYCAKNGQQAIEKWRSWQPDLIWIDIRMPKIDGYEATKKIRKLEGKNQKTIIIALTANVSVNEREKLLKAGCNDFVTKPFCQDTIFEKIGKYLGVKYIYEESDENFSLSFDSSSYNLTPKVFEGLPQNLLIQLEEAAAIGHSNKVREIINQLPDSHQELASSLTELVNRFRLDKISESLEIIINKQHES